MTIWFLAAFLAFFVKGLCGFANTLVFTSILNFANSNAAITPVELLLGYPTNAIIVWKERDGIRWRMCLPLCLLVLAGNIPGALFLKSANATLIKAAFGMVIIVIGAENLLREFRPGKAKQSGTALVLIGLLSGILCGLYGVGALLGAYLSRVTEDSRSFKANLCTVFLVDNTFRMLLYAFSGLLTADVCMYALMLSPAMLLGLFLGMRCARVLDERIAKRFVSAALMISGAVLFMSSL